ncbi:MAG: HU family DNA-binding protein [Pseudomonadales bacterium]|nr:HU family DNA-binding protein [Pseudomonadales bacterium]
MKKLEVAKTIALNAELSADHGSEVLNYILDTITLALSRGDVVSLPNFGSFQLSNRKARVGRNPKTGEPLNIAASTSVRFKPGKGLKEAVATTLIPNTRENAR